MAAGTRSNVRTGQVTVGPTSWVAVPSNFKDVLTLYIETAVLMVSVGHETPADNTCFRMPVGSCLEVNPAPMGKVFLKSAGASQTVYMIGS